MQAKNLEELELQQPFLERTFRPLAARLSESMGRMASSSFQDKAEKRLALAGNPGNLRVADWLGIKAVAAVVGALLFFFLFGIVGVLGLPPVLRILMGGIGLLFGYTIPEFWLGGRVKKRQHAVLLQIPDALDLLTISVRAGLGFDAALAKVVEKLEGPLTDEFRRALAEVRVGRTRREALRDIVPRTEVAPLTNFIGAIIQAEQLGVSISKVLQVQSEQLRIERRQRAEENGREGADQDAVPAGRVHLPVAVHHHPRAGDHPDHAEPEDLGRALVSDGKAGPGGPPLSSPATSPATRSSRPSSRSRTGCGRSSWA